MIDSAPFRGVLFWHHADRVALEIGEWGQEKGPATLPNDISLLKFVEITPGCWEAEIKLLDTRNF